MHCGRQIPSLAVTKNFSQTELLGTGSFGSVYKGTLEGLELVTVKRISACSRQGEHEFISEISTICRLRHRNLCSSRDGATRARSCCSSMTSSRLDNLIFRQRGGEHQNQPPLNWSRRHGILCGLASALLYLHEEWEQKVVHRDVKPSNVMLDGTSASPGSSNTTRHIQLSSTKLAGTPGHWAPECVYTSRATTESDVFSFGVVVLEVASRRRVVERNPQLEEENLVDWIWDLYGQGGVINAADPRLKGDFEEEQMKRALILGLACSHPDPQLRPSIREALQVLINPSEPLMLLSSSRPLVIYVVLPPIAPLISLSASSH